MHYKRYLKKLIQQDLAEKMVFVGGPRQVGKTTLAKQFIKSTQNYYLWDDLDDRAILKSHHIPIGRKTIVLDEIHKYRRWRTLVKGLYDKYSDQLKIIVTGSARLDYYCKGGDSLVGRYHYFRLHPFSISELKIKSVADSKKLLDFGGFPEPYLKGSKTFLRRWQREYQSRVVYQDLRDLSNLRDISAIELLVDALPARVGSLFSHNSLAEDLEVSPHTIKNWIQNLERVYFCYSISPYGSQQLKAVKKQQKLYLWDWSLVASNGARFENMVANHLLKFCHYQEDVFGFKMELRFLRHKLGHEIDFVILRDGRPIFAVECKSGEKSLSRSISYFRKRLDIPKYYQVHLGESEFGSESNGRVLPFHKFCVLEDLP